MLSTHQFITPGARSLHWDGFPLSVLGRHAGDRIKLCSEPLLPGPQTAGASAQPPLLGTKPRPGPPASETARVLDTQPSPSLHRPGGTLRGDECWHRGQGPCRATQQKDPCPGAPSYLESRPVHVFGQFHANPVCHNEAVIRIDLSGQRPQFAREAPHPGMKELSPGRGEGHTCVCTGHTFRGQSTTKGTFNLAGAAGRGQGQHGGGPLPCTL